MRKMTRAKQGLALTAALALSVALVGCGGGGGNGVSDTSQGTAATVNGVAIGEKAVTEYIADFRADQGLESDEDWAQWVVDYGYTPETVRDEVIDYYINQELYDQAAKELGVEVSQDDVDAMLAQTKSMFESDEAFATALENAGMTEEEYVENVVEPNVLQQKLAEAVEAQEAPSSEDVLVTLNNNIESINGSKRSSHILFSSEDDAKAQEVLDAINAGEITFEEAAQENSLDGSATNGGDVGWDCTATFVEDYQNALDGLGKDDVSGLVTSQYGIHIIKCTDEFTVDGDEITDVSVVPEDIVEFYSNTGSTSSTVSFYTWFAEFRENADITINEEMPENAPYNVDLSGYTSRYETTTLEETTPAGDEAETGTDADADTDTDTAEPAEGEAGAAEGEPTAQSEGTPAAE